MEEREEGEEEGGGREGGREGGGRGEREKGEGSYQQVFDLPGL